MKILFLSLFICLFHLGYGQDVKEEFIKNELVPDILNTPPEELIVVNYPDRFARLGNELTPAETKCQPEIDFNVQPNTFHTLLMVDLDASISKGNHDLRSILHWMVVNIPGNNVTLGQTKAEYLPPGAPKDSGLHRYVFLVYEQNGKIDFDEKEIQKNDRISRIQFSVQDFEKKYGFKGPIAGNFFVAQWDESVTE